MPNNHSPLVPGVATVSQASAMALGFAEMSQANSIAMVMYNAAAAQQAAQQVELTSTGMACAQIIAAGVQALAG